MQYILATKRFWYNAPLFPHEVRYLVTVAQVVGYVRERELQVMEEEAASASPDALAALWGILRVLCLNEGNLRPSPPAKGKTAGEPVGTAFASESDVLLGVYGR